MTSVDTRTTRAAATATFVVFGGNGLVFASWAARIPAVTEMLGLSSGQMGVFLLCIAVGSLLALPSAGWVVGRIGTASTLRGAGLVAAAAMAGVAVSLWTGSLVGLGASLFVYGIGIGLWDVVQNIEGADVEHRLGRTVMPQFHAAFSAGAFVGALIGAGLAGLGVGLPAHLLAVAVLALLLTLTASRFFLPHAGPSQKHDATADGERADAAGRIAWLEPRTLLIGGIVLGATLAEGAGNDWIAKAAVDGLGTSEPVGALLFALFVAAMTVMRFVGGGVIDRFGRVAVLRASMSAVVAGLALFVFGGHAIVVGAGAVLWGVGAALAFPIGISAAADDPVRAAARVSVVSTIGYLAFLAGPPLLGFVGDLVGIHRALLVICAPALLALLLAGAARPVQKQ